LLTERKTDQLARNLGNGYNSDSQDFPVTLHLFCHTACLKSQLMDEIFVLLLSITRNYIFVLSNYRNCEIYLETFRYTFSFIASFGVGVCIYE